MGRKKDYQPVVVVGAPRSGTNILRDLLCRIDGTGTWPCDEINYIWRHGNLSYPSDELPPKLARPAVARYIRGRFDRLALRAGLDYVVEKTCANSLRVGFVDRVLTHAHYIFIVRDGIDATASALKRWSAPLDPLYILRKARFVPLLDAPVHAVRFLYNRLHRVVSSERRLAGWGPRFDGMDRIMEEHTLPEVCGLQWKACVESANSVLSGMGSGRVHNVRYERLVREPVREVGRICEFMGVQVGEPELARITSDVTDRSVGRGHDELGAEVVGRLIDLIGPTLDRFGYSPPGS